MNFQPSWNLLMKVELTFIVYNKNSPAILAA